MSPRHQNRLAKEASAYLRQHAHNPVDWHPWGVEALEKAKREDKPILLSIGYSACHWCHVMERESFDDEATALLVNTHFVPIKVDREERPDLDQIYQTVVQLLGRSGGWPLTVFLTPDQRPFYAGTYFPPVPRYGMPSFSEVLTAVREAYDARRDDVVLQAKEITEAIAKVSDLGRSNGRAAAWTLGPDLLERASKKLSQRFDDEHGGFGSRPKFPSTMNVEVLLRRAFEDHDGTAEARVRRALDAMRAGGIWDHLGGGFHRYSTDEKWLVPHFEKMLYDNAQLLRLYLDAGRALSSSAYVEVARDVTTYLLREMQDASGAFYATQDADSEGEEGKFFVWKPEEIDRAVSDPLARDVAKAFFGVTEEGNFEDTGATVLSEVTSIDRIAIKLGKAPSEIEAALARAKAAMLEAREKRPKPFRDEKMLACWNGLAIGALAELGAAIEDDRILSAAKRAFDAIAAKLVEGGRVARYFTKDGAVLRPGYLDDHANVASAALDLFEATGETRYVDVARAIADEIGARFWDEKQSSFFFAPSDGEALLTRMKDPYDQATPSGAAVAAALFSRLATLVGGASGDRAARHLEALAPAAVDNPFGLGQTICALDRLVHGATEVVIVGPSNSADARALRNAAMKAWVPNRVLATIDPSDPKAASFAIAEGKPAGKDGKAVAYVCRNRTCSAPVADPAALRALLRP